MNKLLIPLILFCIAATLNAAEIAKINQFDIKGSSFNATPQSQIIFDAVATSLNLKVTAPKIIKTPNGGSEVIQAEANQTKLAELVFNNEINKLNITSRSIVVNTQNNEVTVAGDIQVLITDGVKNRQVAVKGQRLKARLNGVNELETFEMSGGDNEIIVTDLNSQDQIKSNASFINYSASFNTMVVKDAVVEMNSDRVEAGLINIDITNFSVSAPKQEGKRINFTRDLNATNQEAVSKKEGSQ